LKGKIVNPINVLQAQNNILLGLQVFERVHPNELPSTHEQIAEEILRGKHNTIWGLLSIIHNSYPQTVNHNDIPLHLLHTGLPYEAKETVKLERSVIKWLQSLRLIKNDPSISLLDIESDIRSGKLLCDLATVLHKNRGKVCKISQTKLSTFENIRRAFELFRELLHVERRFLWSEKQIYKGDRDVMLGLLEDLHKFDDKVKWNGPGPYYGKYEIMKLKTSNSRSHTPSLLQYGAINPDKGHLNSIPLMKSEDVSIAYPISYSSNRTQNELQKQNKSFTGNKNKVHDEKKLIDWIKKLGVKIKVPLCSSESICDQFRDGVLLVRVLEKLERKAIRGICEHPKSSAHSLHNIHKVLDILKLKKTIPINYLYSETEIFKGNKSIILGLLTSIKLSYPLNK